MWCTECGKECNVREIVEEFDYEYWGAPGTHKTTQEVSACCEADMVEDGEHLPAPFNLDNVHPVMAQALSAALALHATDAAARRADPWPFPRAPITGAPFSPPFNPENFEESPL